MLIHRLLRSIGISAANCVPDLQMPLVGQLFGSVVSLDLVPSFHQPIHHRCMHSIEDHVIRDTKENSVKLNIALHKSGAIPDCFTIFFERTAQFVLVSLSITRAACRAIAASMNLRASNRSFSLSCLVITIPTTLSSVVNTLSTLGTVTRARRPDS